MRGEGSKVGSRAWFEVDSKSFKISVEVLNGKLTRVITKRGRGFSSWIRFGERGLSMLLEGVEVCCQKEELKVFNNSWLEGGRSYKLQLRSNEAGRYLWCSVFSAEAHHFVLIFPKGKGLLGGWFLLAQKLRTCGVELPIKAVVSQSDPVRKGEPLRGVGAAVKRGLEYETVWLQFGGVNAFNKMQTLNWCLVGWWGDFLDDVSMLSPLKEWARYHWRLKGNLSLYLLGRTLFLFEFENPKEVERVLQEGERIFKQKTLVLERWDPTIGCNREGVHAKEAWVRLVGLPLCLWHRDFFKQVGDACEGFLGVDEESVGGKNLQGARIFFFFFDK